ncbi:MAG: putative transcriptional regulator, GntR family protein [Streptosporangiaceae bacterium]|nr:putative transcriptional regulator, GntR family protein [Streptosporangiaceae bacterium]
MAVIHAGSVGAQTLEWLRAQVTGGAWKPGARIPTEAELVQAIGVGRNTVREAVKALVCTGLLEIRRGDGTFVRHTSEVSVTLGRRLEASELVHTHEVRRALEKEAIALACARRTDADLDRLSSLLSVCGQADVQDDHARFADVDLAFHTALVAASRNPVLIELFESIGERMRATYTYTAGLYRAADDHPAHLAVLAAVRDREPGRALAAANAYLDPGPDRMAAAQALGRGRPR